MIQKEAVVARVEVLLLGNGQVQARCQVQDRNMLTMLMGRALCDLDRQLAEKEREPMIEVAPAGMLVH